MICFYVARLITRDARSLARHNSARTRDRQRARAQDAGPLMMNGTRNLGPSVCVCVFFVRVGLRFENQFRFCARARAPVRSIEVAVCVARN